MFQWDFFCCRGILQPQRAHASNTPTTKNPYNSVPLSKTVSNLLQLKI